MSDQRILLLNKFLNHEDNLRSLQEQIATFPWDYEGEPVVLNKAAVVNTLSQYADGTLQSVDVNGWADFLELRDDIKYEHTDEVLLSEIMHELANPETEGELTLDRAFSLLETLRA